MQRIELPPFPRGWFAVAFSSELGPGDVVARTYFGQALVVFRGLGGRVGVLDAYCAHLGAHLGEGGKVGHDSIICPFHGWRWSDDGRCAGMPYGGRIPPAAKTRAWPVVEQDGVVLAWNDPDGGAPMWEMPSFGDRRWSVVRTMTRTVRSHPQEILENVVDCAHFRFVHETHMVRPTSEPRIDGPLFEMTIESDPAAVGDVLHLDEGFLVEGSTFCHGAGLAAATIGTKGMTFHGLQRLYATPVDGERIDLRGLVNVEVTDDEDGSEALAELLAHPVFENWDRDIAIWDHKRYQARPVLNRSERLIPVFRRWYSQFYEPGSPPPG
jgi:3-ketosteroid 9alpha-monooxygenase subunit A